MIFYYAHLSHYAEGLTEGNLVKQGDVIAYVGDTGNAGSIALHRRFGFHHSGTLAAVGFKFGRWVDSVLMQRALGSGDTSLPS